MTDNVGYKRPPRESRFKPGQSGNPSGRPGIVRNLKSDLLEELQEQTAIIEQGQERLISKQQAFIKALVGAASKGDPRATSTLVSFCARALGGQPDAEPEPGADDFDIVESYAARERKRRRLENGDADRTDQKQEKPETER